MLVTNRIRRTACALLALLSSATAQANVGEAFGFGSRTAALGGAGVSFGYGGFAAYHNPAGLPFEGDKRLLVDVSVLAMVPKFLPIRNVIVENAYTSDKVTFSDVEEDYRSVIGQQFGLVYRLFPKTLNFTFGVAAYLPLQQVAYMDTGETFVPEYVLYRSRPHRPQIEIGVGGDLGRGFKAGIGFHLAFALTGSGTVFIQTDATKPSTMRFAASLKPKIAPTLGLLYAYDRPGSPRSGDSLDASAAPSDGPLFTLGAVLRLPVSSPNNFFLRSGARAFGSFAALDFNFKALSALYYDPLALELGGSIAEGSRARTVFQLEYQRWSKFESPALFIQDPKNESCGDSPCGVNISGGKNPAFEYKDILVPRIGQELVMGQERSVTLRAGYAFRPSIFKFLPTGPGNYLDPPKHIFTAGLGFQFKRFLHFDVPCTLDLNVAWHQFLTQQITKTPGDENGNGTGDLKIGAPGYEAGGKMIGGGVDLSLAF